MGPAVPLMIDSGAYSAFTKQSPIDLQAYIDYLHRVIPWFQKHHVPLCYINLDVIGDDGSLSYANWKEIRRQGLDPLPVYHAKTDIRWLKKYLNQTDYIGLGTLTNVYGTRLKMLLDRLWHKFFVDRSGMPVVKVHGLGATTVSGMRRYPWYSVDSTSWLRPAAFGKIFVPAYRDGQWQYLAQPDGVFVSLKSGKIGSRVEHYRNRPPRMKKRIDDYLEYIGIGMGETRTVDGQMEIVEAGVENSYWVRCQVNALFYLRMFQSLVWPRPFQGKWKAGFFASESHVTNGGPVASGTPTIYLSGEIPIENFLSVAEQKQACSAGVLLTYYSLRVGENCRAHRRLVALSERRPYEAPKRQFSTSVE